MFNLMPKFLIIVEAIKDFFYAAVKSLKKQIESRLETLEILEDKEFTARLSVSIEQERNEETASWSDALAQLNW